MPSNEEDIARVTGAQQIGFAFVQNAILLNGGAFVVLLGYMATSSVASVFVLSLCGLKIALACFLLGIVSVMFALAFLYLYTAPNFESSIKHWLDRKIISANMFLCVVSVLAFAFGVITLIATASSAP